MGCADTGPMTQSPKQATRLGLSRTHTKRSGLFTFMGSNARHPLLYHTPSFKRCVLLAATAVSLSAGCSSACTEMHSALTARIASQDEGALYL